MTKKETTKSELENLRSLVAELETIEQQHKKTENELKAANQQLDASLQQLKAAEQQLKAYNEQLQASEQEIKAKEAMAQAAREFAENIIDTIRHPLLVLDENLHVVSANRFFYATFNVEEKETTGKKLYELGNYQWNIPQLKNLLKNILPQQTAVEDFEVKHHFENIGKKNMLLNARELMQEEGKKRLILLAIEDITHRRTAEKEMQRLNTELQQKADELQQILYITTHDLRSPLVNIEGFSKEMQNSVSELNEMLRDAPVDKNLKSDLFRIMDEEIPEAIHFITLSTSKMDNLLKGLLTLSRLGRQKFSFQKLNMNRLIKQAIDTFKFEIDQSEVKIEVDNLPSCTGDELQINQLFSNLIGNALKFLDPERKGEINISGQKQENGCTFIVEDNGIGISEVYQHKVFNLFEKLDPKKPGIGLGMNIVKQIVEKHNGTVQLDSVLGKGTKFIIFIPD